VVLVHDFLQNSTDCIGIWLMGWTTKTISLLFRILMGGLKTAPFTRWTDFGWIGSQKDVYDAVSYMERNYRVNMSTIFFIGLGSADLISVAKYPEFSQAQ